MFWVISLEIGGNSFERLKRVLKGENLGRLSGVYVFTGELPHHYKRLQGRFCVFSLVKNLKVSETNKRVKSFIYYVYNKISLEKVSKSCWKYRKHSYLCCRKQYETTIKTSLTI